jgi:hypothetical protein
MKICINYLWTYWLIELVLISIAQVWGCNKTVKYCGIEIFGTKYVKT